ncbi:YbaB/EbfC family nucleoid-associated protein [Neoehrlichia mikurensis]|uniref:YbaB/EbfC family nucleoid-associated protein n=1 Tax=Neoehrlichia mikurensis TaxID=89586 RepID=A0A9Q9BW95_9RICK|nr:YbaB/EbfC family nucleoid-associated protein [Neoehrlichia mikurensis]QXK92332.1 YbaB/EbfC family nucleoid-associated protein [Neoehrlichia mikurensis]QXK92786.1 YbaB/EbfC family nucleoid-associated protein [Neoehrlichia mikurensis]QXK94027.1 YbaB/EbfC family nucleoid-associated protein [Neoehrlichia mikurensis]UTO55808.1 YbaB/EbfC family nucleoid-associated protein [Neoehrlichia mikurensis]UTO56723.1 YbaB/EbfC family nucleoid-associated protein [Neoehrlichia mikurensis]
MSFDNQQFSNLQDIIQKKFSEFQNYQKTQVFEGSSLGGKVSVKLSLSNIINYQVQEIKLDPSLLSEKSILIEDLIKAAFNDAFKKSSDYNTHLISSLMSFNI